jgi:subtilase family serine protease
VSLTGADLVVSAMTNPPATINLGASFAHSVTVQNIGSIGAGTSTARFYLSADQVFNTGDRMLSATRAVDALGSGASFTGPVTLVVPTTTPFGTYYLLACADDLRVVSESDETNNCRASTTTVQATGTDLVVAALTEPPAVVSLGANFSATETVQNLGNGSAGTSTTRYYLSVDAIQNSGDRRLTTTRTVPAKWRLDTTT